MPTGLVKKVAKQTGKSVATVETKWEKAKSIASEKLKEGSPRFYALTTAIFKKLTKTGK